MADELNQPLDRLPKLLALSPVVVVDGAGCIRFADGRTIRPAQSDAIWITPPGSKSLTNRALLLAGLARGRSILHQPLIEADDTRRMIEALGKLGVTITRDTEAHALVIEGVNGSWPVGAEGVSLYLHNAGTATRFLTAAAALSQGPVTIDGNERMRQRPIGQLGTVLPKLGCRIEYLDRQGYPPIRIEPNKTRDAGEVVIELHTTESSQFISGLLMLGPWLEKGITIQLCNEITSPSYIRMTLKLLDNLGACVQSSEDLRTIHVGPPVRADQPGGGLEGFELAIEPDASGATYFWAAGALLGGREVRVLGIGEYSLQGDAQFPQLLQAMGAQLRSIHISYARGGTCGIGVVGQPVIEPLKVDMHDMPDAAMTLAAVCCFAQGRSEISGLRTLRVKETDRIAALQNELAKIGVRVATDIAGDPDAISITPPKGGIDCSADCERVIFETYDDHRMAMSLALIALRRPNCVIANPACVGKTYPGFWAAYSKLGC